MALTQAIGNRLFGRNKGIYPDFGITEKLSGTKNSNQRIDPSIAGYSSGAPSSISSADASYGYSSVSGGGSGGGSSSSYKSATSKNASANRNLSALEKLRQLEIEQINKAYDSEKKRLGGLEKLVGKQYSSARGRLEAYRPQLEQEKGTQLSGLANEEQARINESRTAMQQFRQLLADQQRKAQAYNAATGNTSSSIQGAQGELFSRQANQGLAGIQTQRSQAMSEIGNRRQQVNDFFSRKSMELNDQLAELEMQHLAQLNEIENARSSSKRAKEKATSDAWRSYVSSRVELENALMNTEAQWDALTNMYGGDLESDLGNFVTSWDGTDQINAPEGFGDIPTVDQGADESLSLRAQLLPQEDDRTILGDSTTNLDLIRLLEAQGALA